jgi:hypothetical protein
MKLTLKAITLAALLAGTSLATQHFIRPALACDTGHGLNFVPILPEQPYQQVAPLPPTFPSLTCETNGRLTTCF